MIEYNGKKYEIPETHEQISEALNMIEMNAEDWIREHVTRETVAMYYTADFGEKLGLYQDGTIAVGQDIGNEIDPEERPVALVGCPGIHNINTTFFSEGWTTLVEDGYLTEDGRTLSLSEMITESCMEGDISDEIEELVQLLHKSFVPKVRYDNLPEDLQAFVLHTDFFTVDAEGYVYDSDERRYLTESDIREQKTYTETGEL